MEKKKRLKLTGFLALQAKPGSSGVTGAGSRQGEPRCEATPFHQDRGSAWLVRAWSSWGMVRGRDLGLGRSGVYCGEKALEERQSQQKGEGNGELQG